MANLGYIQITRICNQECLFCSSPENQSLISVAEAKRIADDYIKLGYEGIIFTGGEPTLHPKLAEIIKYVVGKKSKIPLVLITNGQRTADKKYFKELVDAGLSRIALSLHSCRPEVHNYLTQNKKSFGNIRKTLENASKFPRMIVNINTVINKYNADHLSETARWVVGNFPDIRHFVWNNIDPLTNRAAKNTHTIPKLNDFELELKKALDFLQETGRTYRVERVPLCYMAEHAHCSTEAREIARKERRATQFLDKRGRITQDKWEYAKADCCRVCFLSDICPGLWLMDEFYSSKELYPVFLDKNKITKRIRYGL